MNFIPFFRPPIKWEYVGPLFFLSFMACQSEQTTFTRIEDSPVIDRLLDSAPHFVVNTETPTERWVAVTQLGIPKDSLILGRPGHMIAVGDSIYISEDSGHNIFAVGNDGYLNRKIGRQGKAPGEFNFIMDIGYNGSYIFVREPNGVQIFTENFEYANSFLTNMNTGLQFRSSVSADYMFLECIGIDWLVCPYSTSPPHARIESGKLLPALDLDNQSGENANLISVSPGGDRIAVAYMGLPYIFIYDDQFRHLKVIRFEGERVRNFSSAVTPPDGSPRRMESGTRSFMTVIEFLNSSYLLVYSKGAYLLDLSENDYELTAKVIFSTFNDTEKVSSPADFLLHKEHLYVSSNWEEYVYGYPFNLD